MSKSAELEIGLHRRDAGVYTVELRFSQPDSEADLRFGQTNEMQATLNLELLSELKDDIKAYSQKLSQDFFADPNLKNAFKNAYDTAQSLEVPLRVRLLIGPSAPELHSLRWETLQNLEGGSPLFTNEQLVFSRYLSSLDWRPVRLRPKRMLHALVVIANPSDLGDYNLAPVDVPGELERARQGMADISIDALPEANTEQYATLSNLIGNLRDKEYDILYLVCHGALVKDEPWLWLEDDQGKVARVSGRDLLTRVKELTQRPRLVILASCQSAGPSEGQGLSALGPRLAESGIPAVIAMQGNVTMETISNFMPVFFKELLRDGQIDRAIAVARGEVRERPDYWMPALFMRLESGRIWYVPGFGKEGKFEKWPALLRYIERGQCTPILGPGLFENMLGSLKEIAQRWAETYHYPLAPHERESLPQVAQYLTVNQYRRAPYDELVDYLKTYIQDRYKADFPLEVRESRVPLSELVSTVARKRRESIPNEPHRVLANMPLPIYITTNPGNQLADSLIDVGKDPQVVLCPWNEKIERLESIFTREPEYAPTPERPLVFHLFGHLDEPDSVVLTEDDYFDYLMGVTSNKDLIPSIIRRALVDTALLFLGFQVDEWNFRVLFRSILTQQGGKRLEDYPHIAAQIEPEEGRILQLERARQYLEKYFSKGADISLYWGSADEFLSELQQRYSGNKR